MSVVNFHHIKEFLSFTEKNDFYFIQLIKRRKDNPDMKKDVKVIRSFYVNSIEEYDELISKIVDICEVENCRAYIRLNKRNYGKLALKLISEIAQNVSNGNDLRTLPNLFDSVAGQYSSDDDKKWIVDIDWKDLDTIMYEGNPANVSDILNVVRELQVMADKEPMVKVIQTKNGVHVVTKPFNPHLFAKKFPTIQVHKDNMTLLYCP